MNLCECGCGQEIEIKPHHKWYGIPRFIYGHQNRGKHWKSPKIQGENNPAKRLEVRKKIGIANSIALKGRHCSPKTEFKKDNHYSPQTEFKRGEHYHPQTEFKRGENIGEKNSRWNPNREEVFTPYTEKFSDLNYRSQIKKEQNYVDLVTSQLLVSRACLHHIDYNKQNDRRENLVWLNLSTHLKTNVHKEEWQQLLQKMNREIIDIQRELMNG